MGYTQLLEKTSIKIVSQNVRGFTEEKMEVIIQNMKEKDVQVACIQETWRVTPTGREEETIDGFLIVHHGEKARSCNRGRLGVAIILNRKARKHWKQAERRSE